MSANSFYDFRVGYIHRGANQTIFTEERLSSFYESLITKRDRRGMLTGWCIFAGYDGRNYALFLFRDHSDKEPMVRVGCRFFTLAQARKHWAGRRRNASNQGRRSAAQILMLIDIAIERAKRRSYFVRRGKSGKYLDNVAPKFNARPYAGTKRKAAR